VKLTPKFHAELAGEGVEYSWAHSKSFYRRRENLKQLIQHCTCLERVLTKVRIEKFAARSGHTFALTIIGTTEAAGFNSEF
jgi:hypothetical protein